MAMYEPHPLSMLFPRMTEDEYRALRDDILAKGLIDPIRVFQERVLDGNHRQRACEETGVTPRYEPFDGDVAAARAFVLSLNLKRRHLSIGQRALIAGRLATIPHGGDRKSDQGRKSALEALTLEEAAKEANVTKDTAKKGRAIVQSGDSDLIAMVDAGKMSLNAAAKKVQAEKPKQERPRKPKRASAAKPTPNDESVDATVECAADLGPAAGVDDPGSTIKPVGAPPAPEGATEELPVPEGAVDAPAAALEPASSTVKIADGSSRGGGLGDNSSSPEPVGGHPAVQEPGAEPPPALDQLDDAAGLSGALGHTRDADEDRPDAADADHSASDPGGAPSSEVKMQRVTIQKKKRKIQHPELFPEEPLPAASEAKQFSEKGVLSGETKNQEPVPSNDVNERSIAAKVPVPSNDVNERSIAAKVPVPSNDVNERSIAAKVLSDEKSRAWYAQRHARRLRDNARCRLFRIVRSIRKLALTPIPQFDDLDELLPPRDRAAITKNLPKAFANLKACEEVISALSQREP